ncbi:chymotrypsinogen B-like [Sarcoptes scabiei]|nr:chymotrypsinogen B-like [Sarcoptes scabiei]
MSHNKYLLFVFWFGVFVQSLQSASINQSKSSNGKTRRMVGGKYASIYAYPWTTLVISKGRCGGSIINESWILTAAHCVNSRKTVVYYGIDQHTSMSKSNQRIVEAVYKPLKSIFNSGDIALLKLAKPIPMNSKSNSIQLYRNRRSLIGSTVSVAGFGRNNLRTDRLLFGTFKVETLFSAKRDVIAARSYRQSPCYGDSGSGLVIEESGSHFLVGVTSSIMTAGCRPNNVALFIDVSYYYDWIVEKMNNPTDPDMEGCFVLTLPLNFKLKLCTYWLTDLFWFLWRLIRILFRILF